jgi:glutamate-1-semialdehyde 2,1-aminomutase
LYTQLMLNRGFLAGKSFYPTLAHTTSIVQIYHQAIDEVFLKIAEALKNNKVDESLNGGVALSGFTRLV